MTRFVGRIIPIALAVSAASCWDFQPDPPAGPGPLPVGRYADVTIEYRQPAHCANNQGTCDARVVFFGSWMGSQDPVVLSPGPSPDFWTGVARNVPANWPPHDEAHRVLVWDPHLQDTETHGAAAARLLVGGQSPYFVEDAGTPQEAGLIYVDDNGVGRNPF